MSRYAWLVCEDSKQVIWLGKICADALSSQLYFHIGDVTKAGNSTNSPLMKAVMKFLATNIGRTLRVWSEEMFDANINDDFTTIGGDDEKSISLDRYVQNFPG